MRIPVFACGANHRVDRPILRKSASYATVQVDELRADWIDPEDHSKGIVCRELIYFGPRAVYEEAPATSSTSMGELPGLRFIPPETANNPNIPKIHIQNLLAAASSWDWSHA